MKSIYLIGFMGAGKSTVAKELVRRLDARLVEMDQWIEEEQGMAITEIFERYGEDHFRDLETELLHTLACEEKLVVSCGGGSVLREENAEAMREHGCIVLLSATPETIYARVKNGTNRPILNGNMNVEYIRELMEKRRERYETVADLRIDTDGKTIGTICEEIISRIQQEGDFSGER